VYSRPRPKLNLQNSDPECCVEFERNDPMAIFEEEELVVDKGMTHM